MSPGATSLAEVVSQQHELLATIAKTEPARAAVEHSSNYIADIQSQILKIIDQIKLLEATTSKEHEDHEKYHDSSWRRVAYHMSGHKDKFESRAKQEEREYVDAVQEEKKAKDKLEKLKHDLATAHDKKVEQDAIAKQNVEAQRELDSLYDAIFAGKTPGLPEEDKKEAVVLTAQKAYDASQAKFSSEQQIVKVLSDAHGSIHEAISQMARAMDKSQMESLAPEKNIGDILDRNPISKAQSAASKTDMLVKQARRMSTQVEDIGPMRIAQNSMMSIFEDPWDPGNLHQKLEQADTELRYASAALASQLGNAKKRAQTLKLDADKLRASLESARAELQTLRTEALTRLAQSRREGLKCCE